jgi:hypothetical protein
MKIKIKLIAIFFFIFQPAIAADLPKEIPQGSLVIGQSLDADEIIVDNNSIKVSEKGHFVFAVGRDHVEPISVTYLKNGSLIKIHQINIIKQDYDIQRIDGLPEQMVTPLDDEIIERIIYENDLIKEKKKINLDLTYFKDSFIQPTEGIISGVFGSQRILNGKAKSPHRGLDIAAETGTPIYACNEGLVIHAEDDLYYTGGTIILDHGHGVKSIYAHLSNVKVTVNQTVSKDDIIGEVGSTGRSTGPHLHWGVMVFNTYVDPQLLLD